MAAIVVRGVVRDGRHLGRKLGFPTANIELATDPGVADGVYRSVVVFSGRRYGAMSNLGCNPTVGGNVRRLETHIFNFEQQLYGEEIEVELREKIRDEMHFASVEELRRQIEADKMRIEEMNDRIGF